MVELIFESVEAEKNSVNPTLNVWVKFKYTDKIAHCFVVSAKLNTRSGKLLSTNCTGFLSSGSQEETLEFLPADEVSRRYGKSEHTNSKGYKFSIELSQAAVAYIENERHTTDEKTVHLQFVVEAVIHRPRFIPLQQSQLNMINGKHQIIIETKPYFLQFSIQHSEWVNRFCSSLGIGKFLLVELGQPVLKNIVGHWEAIYEKMKTELVSMENDLRKGEWKYVMISARKVFENLKVFSGKPAEQPLHDDFVEAFKANNHNEDGIKALEQGIKSMFDFCSKYIHDKNKHNASQPTPIATKEDAEFVYSMLLGFINLLGAKLQALG